MSVERFRSVLARLGPDPAPREIAEILWLATRLPSAGPHDATDGHQAALPHRPDDTADGAAAVPTEEGGTPGGALTVPLHPPATAPARGDAPPGGHVPGLPAGPVRLAADPPLPRQLDLLRALRPLKRRVPSRHAGELDEEATLDAMARRSTPQRRATLLPVLRPTRERWLDVTLVVDGHPTGLLLWTPLAREVHRLLVHLGAFRDVRTRYLHTRSDGSAGLSAHPAPHRDRIRDAAEIHDPSGRRLVLVLTDGIAPRWQNPSLLEAMRKWAAIGPLAVLQTLPERLWPRTALPTVPARLRRTAPSAADTELAYVGRLRGARELPAGSVPVPVLELSPEWLRPWAGLVAGTTSGSTNAAVTLLTAHPEPPRSFDDARTPTRRLQDFHATATPEAFRLLACLSVVPLSVVIMRVVQAAMLPGSPPTVLAEVMFSGLIAPASTDGSTAPADVPHDFLPGVRAALLESLRTHEVDRILREVSALVERGTDRAAGRVSGLLPSPTGGAEVPADGIPWAHLREEVLARAGLTTAAAEAGPFPAQAGPSSPVQAGSSSPAQASYFPPAQGPSSSAQVWPPPADSPGNPAYAEPQLSRSGGWEDPVRAEDTPYRLRQLLTTADFSDVYLGTDVTGRQAVVKVRPYGSHPRADVFRALLGVEAEALRRMDGRYAPPLLGTHPEESPTSLAMGYVESVHGGAARNLLNVPWSRNGPPDDVHALTELARGLARALDRAHSAGIVHGNLSPHAVLVVPGTIVLISWVYAQFDGRVHPYPQFREDASGYLPPEGYARNTPLDPSFDIYGLGAILLHEVTGGPLGSHNPRDLARLPSELGGLRELIGRCLDVQTAERPTARTILAELADDRTPPRADGDPAGGVRP